MNAKLVWGGGLVVFLGLGVGAILWPNAPSKDKQVVNERLPRHNTHVASGKVSLSESAPVGEAKPSSNATPTVAKASSQNPSSPKRRYTDREARILAFKLRPGRQLTRDEIVADFIKLKGEERKNHPGYKAFIADGGTDEELDNYKFNAKQNARRRGTPVRLTPELRRKDFVIAVGRGDGKTRQRASVDIELRINKHPGPKDMILILRHSEVLKPESFFAHSILQIAQKTVTFQKTGTPGESLIHIRGNSTSLSTGKLLTLRFTVEGRDPSVTPIFIREISQLGVQSPNAGTVGNVMQLR